MQIDKQIHKATHCFLNETNTEIKINNNNNIKNYNYIATTTTTTPTVDNIKKKNNNSNNDDDLMPKNAKTHSYRFYE